MVSWTRRLLAAAVAVGAGVWGAGLAYVGGRQEWPPPSAGDAVLVLGTSATVRGAPNPCMRTRVLEGVRLIQEGLAPVLIVSGGFDPRDGQVEADAMATIAREMGLPDEQVLIEGRATSTIENLTYSRDLLAAVEHPRFVVVTEPFHMPRAVVAADRLGIDVDPAPTPRCPNRDPTWILREPAALVWYRWKLR